MTKAEKPDIRLEIITQMSPTSWGPPRTLQFSAHVRYMRHGMEFVFPGYEFAEAPMLKALKGLTVRAQADERNSQFYGQRIEYEDGNFRNSAEVAAMAKTLKQLEARMAKVTAQRGSTYDLTEYLVRFLFDGLGAITNRPFARMDKEAAMADPHGWVFGDADDLRWRLNKQLSEVFGKE